MMFQRSTLIYSDFNSIKVQLKQPNKNTIYNRILFQFHKGTIKTVLRKVIAYFVMYFNSIKVQLKLSKEKLEYRKELFLKFRI